jgi:hypothetical protein
MRTASDPYTAGASDAGCATQSRVIASMQTTMARILASS